MDSALGEGENAASGDPAEVGAEVVPANPEKTPPKPQLRNVLLERGWEAVRPIPPRVPFDHPKKACKKRGYRGTRLVGTMIKAT